MDQLQNRDLVERMCMRYFFTKPHLEKHVSSDTNIWMHSQLNQYTFLCKQLLKHQQVIEELIEENQILRQILAEDFKVPLSKLQAKKDNRRKAYYPCSDCFKCRRRRRKAARQHLNLNMHPMPTPASLSHRVWQLISHILLPSARKIQRNCPDSLCFELLI